MSYRVAFVLFGHSERFYPVNCNRGDIQAGDEVFVAMPKLRVHKKAVVKAVEFLNWNCQNSIYCLASELKRKDKYSHIVEQRPSDIRFHTKNDLITFLIKAGWSQIERSTTRSPLYYWTDNRSRTARLRFHGKGIDIQVFEGHAWMSKEHTGRVVPHVHDGNVARHRYYHSGRCIFEFVADFSDDFLNNIADLSQYLKQIGQDGPKKSNISKFQVGKSSDIEGKTEPGLTLSELYTIMSDGGSGPAYLGDGLYIGSDGSVFD